MDMKLFEQNCLIRPNSSDGNKGWIDSQTYDGLTDTRMVKVEKTLYPATNVRGIKAEIIKK